MAIWLEYYLTDYHRWQFLLFKLHRLQVQKDQVVILTKDHNHIHFIMLYKLVSVWLAIMLFKTAKCIWIKSIYSFGKLCKVYHLPCGIFYKLSCFYYFQSKYLLLLIKVSILKKTVSVLGGSCCWFESIKSIKLSEIGNLILPRSDKSRETVWVKHS